MSFDVWDTCVLLQYMDLAPMIIDDHVELLIGDHHINYSDDNIVVTAGDGMKCSYPWSYLIAHDVTEMIQKRVTCASPRRKLIKSC